MLSSVAIRLRALWLKLLPTRRLLLLTPIAVLLFVAAHMVTAHEESQIDAYSASIATSTSPSIQRLTEIGAIMRDMNQLTLVALEGGSAEDPVPRTTFKALDDALHTKVAEYLELPTIPAAKTLWLQLDHGIDDFERNIDRVLDLMERGAAQDAHTFAHNELRPQRLRAFTAISMLIDVNAGETLRLSQGIRRIRGRVSVEVYVLQALALLVSLFVVGLAWRSLRAQARVAEDRRRLAEERAQELELFAGRVAHDLKSPLGAMLLRVGVAQRKSGDETYTRLSRQIQSMGRVVDGLLEFALSGARPEPGARAHLHDVISEVEAALQDEVGAAGIELAVPSETALEVACSPGALSSVLRNLTLNALKFLEDRPVKRISIRAIQRGERVRVEVEDTGPGVPAGQERAIFEPYVRLPSARHVPGLGLGLATVKRVVEAYGGEVGVRPGEGACFWFELPRVAMATGSVAPWVH